MNADLGARRDHYLLAAMEASEGHTREAIRHAITAALDEINTLRAALATLPPNDGSGA